VGDSLPPSHLRTFFGTHRQAKTQAFEPRACSVCEAFDRCCIHCPSDRDQWFADPATGFTASTGHFLGRSVCSQHKDGAIPEGIDSREVISRPFLEVHIGSTFLGVKTFDVEFRIDTQEFGIRAHVSSEVMNASDSCLYHRALGLAVTVTSSLNASLDPRTDASGLTARSPGRIWPRD
jgi:hypothetical protein